MHADLPTMVAGPSEDAPSLPYHEPEIVTILVQTSFLLLLNIINSALDRVLYCGLLGQVLVGIAWGTPAAKLLSTNVEEAIVQFGYLGLILLVFEGSHTFLLRSNPSSNKHETKRGIFTKTARHTNSYPQVVCTLHSSP
jgi:hypothetical protein